MRKNHHSGIQGAAELLRCFDGRLDLLLMGLDSEAKVLEQTYPRFLMQNTYGRNVLLKLIEEMRFGDIACYIATMTQVLFVAIGPALIYCPNTAK